MLIQGDDVAPEEQLDIHRSTRKTQMKTQAELLNTGLGTVA